MRETSGWRCSAYVARILTDAFAMSAADGNVLHSFRPPAATKIIQASREALAALGGSMVSACVMYPLDLLKTRMQAGKPGEHTLLRACRAVVREDGMSGLYRGLRTDLLKVSTHKAALASDQVQWIALCRAMFVSFLLRFMPLITDACSPSDALLGGSVEFSTLCTFLPTCI